MLNNKGVIKENVYSVLLNEERKTKLYVPFFCDKTYIFSLQQWELDRHL